MIGNGFLVLVLNLICLFASIDKFVHSFLDGTGAFCNLFDDFLVTFGELVCGFNWEYNRHIADVLQQLRLVMGGDRDDMVHRDVTEDACFNLDFLRVGFPLHLVTSL